MTPEEVERGILKAARAMKRKKRVGPNRSVSSWPMVGDWTDVDHMDRVMYLWLGPKSPINRRERMVVWIRLGGGYIYPYRSCAKTMKLSHEKVRMIYKDALKLLAMWLTEMGF